MSKMTKPKKTWFYVALGGLVMSLLSFFLPIISCSGINFNILDFLNGNILLQEYVIDGYWGPVIVCLTSGWIAFLAIIAVAALVCAIVGLVTLQAQRPNTRNFVLTIIGLVGVMIPSLIIIILVVGFRQYYILGLSMGIAPILSPIAIIISISAVIRRKNKVAEEYRKKVEEEGLIRPAGDL